MYDGQFDNPTPLLPIKNHDSSGFQSFPLYTSTWQSNQYSHYTPGYVNNRDNYTVILPYSNKAANLGSRSRFRHEHPMTGLNHEEDSRISANRCLLWFIPYTGQIEWKPQMAWLSSNRSQITHVWCSSSLFRRISNILWVPHWYVVPASELASLTSSHGSLFVVSRARLGS